MHVFICMSLYVHGMSLYVCLYMYVFTCMSLYACLYMYVFICMSLYVCLYMYVFICMSLHVCLYMYVFICMSLYVCLYMYVFICMSLHVCLYMYEPRVYALTPLYMCLSLPSCVLPCDLVCLSLYVTLYVCPWVWPCMSLYLLPHTTGIHQVRGMEHLVNLKKKHKKNHTKKNRDTRSPGDGTSSKPWILEHFSQSGSLECSTLDPMPYTPKPKPQIPNPKR